jgi:catechol 2,3-dioxygenase-like lactoylglutathione lyase family enzyme
VTNETNTGERNGKANSFHDPGERRIAFYCDVFDMTVKDRFDYETFTLIYLLGSGSSFELELTINKGRTDPYDLGDGYQIEVLQAAGRYQ